ncbi:redox-regulated ATPase YchF [Candidatus Peregrinibacteria bacterium]|nr:redox-regulated ATPase YchF [Candidatus Peregrinibacteria bacterium]
MSLKIGIVGLPNVGKSTLFNALTRSRSADAQNYPFCTIDPNIGVVEVPDERLQKLADISKSGKIVPAVIEFVDIAGLVKGASLGEGLGNQFLSHIRECDAIAQVVRVFNDSNVIHVHGKIDPRIDREVVESELILSDLQTLEKRLHKAVADAKSGSQEKKQYAELLSGLKSKLESGILASNIDFSADEKMQLRDLHLLTMKPVLYIINIPEDELKTFDAKKYAEMIGIDAVEKIIPVCAKLEAELGDLNAGEANEYLKELGISETGLSHLIRTAYSTLGLITFLTSGPMESRAWTITKGSLAPQAAGAIHTDFEKGFIKAEVIKCEDFIRSGGESKAKEAGLMRLEGKEYIVRDGDVMHFKFN